MHEGRRKEIEASDEKCGKAWEIGNRYGRVRMKEEEDETADQSFVSPIMIILDQSLEKSEMISLVSLYIRLFSADHCAKLVLTACG